MCKHGGICSVKVEREKCSKRNLKLRNISITDWLNKVKNIVGNKFKFKDIPKHLKDRSLIMKARNEKLIIEIERNKRGVLWSILI